jgi:predicted ATPase
MGLHTGEALVRGADYVGHDVHKAKRVCDAGHGGQILLSQTTADLVGASMALRDLGPHRLKDLGEPQRLFQVVADDLPGDFPPLRSLESFSNNLPLSRSTFIGREHEIAAVRKLLDTHRLVTLTGIGGCGKTRLALQVGAEIVEHYPDGVFFVELGPLSDPELVPPAIGDAVGLPSGPLGAGPGVSADEQLLGYLSQRTCLIIVDNCEHLLDASAEIVDRVQRRCPRVTILATSREVLGVEGEQAYGVPSLEVPPEDAVDSEAVSLFLTRAQTARPQFEITAENNAMIAEICRRLDGIPLAIEFAAARVTHLSPKQIAQKLDDRFRLLTGGRRNVQRQQTLQAALDWSYDLLTEPERVLLRRLAVFPADFGLEAAEGICAEGELDASAVTDLLGSLVAKSLVLAEPVGDEVRYRLLETVRAYASERLTHADEAERLRDAHRDWYLARLESIPWDESVTPEIGGFSLAELANLRAGVEWSQAQGADDLVLRLFARNMWWTYTDRRLIQSLPAVDVDNDVRASCLLLQGMDAQMDLDTGRGLGFIERAVETARDADPALLAIALAYRGWFGAVLAAWSRDPEQARAARRDFDEALARSSGLSPSLSGYILTRRGEIELTLNDIPAAVVALEAAVHKLDEGGFSMSAGYAKMYLVAALHVLDDSTRAASILETVLAARPEFTELAGIGGFDGTAACVVCGVDQEEAKSLLLGSLRDVSRSAMPGALEEWVLGVAAVLAQCGDNERASRLLAWVRSVTYDIGIGTRTPAAHTIYFHYVARVRDALDRETVHRCRDEGRAMSRDEAVAQALDGLR